MSAVKIYYIANARMPNPKAHGIQLAKMCEALAGTGVELELILPRKKAEAAGDIFTFYGLKRRFAVRRLPVLDLFPKTRIGFNLSALTFALSYFFYLRGKRGIIYTIDLDQFSFSLIPFLKMPYFFETHATKRANRLYRFFLRRVSGLLAINERIKTGLASTFGIAPEKILVFPNGIDLEMFGAAASSKDAKRELGISDGSTAVVYIGRFYNWKGLEIIPNVARLLGGEVKFYLVGGRPEEFKKIAGVSEIPENIVCVPPVPQREIPRWLRAADLLLLLGTAKNEYSYEETSPMKLFEYMASGKPIVAVKTPAVQEVVSGREVFFYMPDDAGSLARTVEEARESPRRREMTRRAAEKVKQFSWSFRAEAVVRFIQSHTP